MEIFFATITIFGNFIFWILISFIFYWLGERKFSKFFISAVLGGFILNTAIKYVVKLPRPPVNEWMVGVESPYGFPSGHSTTIFLAATYLTLRNRRYFPIYALAVLVAYSRVFLKVHYPMDVVGGAFLGLTTAFIFWFCEKKFEINYKHSIFLFLITFLIFMFFPIRPELTGGLTAGFGASLITYLNQEKGSWRKVFIGFTSTLAVFAPYFFTYSPILKTLISFTFIYWALTLYPYFYRRVTGSEAN